MNRTQLRVAHLYLFLLSIVAIACSDSKNEKEIQEIIIPENVLTEGMGFAKEGETKTLSIKATVQPKLSSNQDWCTIAPPTTDAKGTYKYNITVAANSKNVSRTATISVNGGDLPEQKIAVVQMVSDGISGETPWQVAKSLGLGWNLGNQMDAFANGKADETCWGNAKTTQTAFNKLAEAGITTVRIPVTWMGHIGSAPNYEIEKAWMNRVAEIVEYAENAGLNAIVNIHHDGSDSNYWLNIKEAATSESKNSEIKATLKAVWTQIAERFKNKGNFLAFESMNEIHDGGWGWGENMKDGGKQYAVLNEWNQLFVDAVRDTGGANANRYLGVPGYCTNPDLTISYFKLPKDRVSNRLMVAVHFYDPYEYTLNAKYSEWGHTGAPAKKVSGGDEVNVKSVFGKLKTAFVDKGIPIYIGEMGCVHRDNDRDESFRKYYLEYVCKAAKDYGMAPIYWDNGATGAGTEQSGLFNRTTGLYVNNGADVMQVMRKAIFTEDSSYTLQSVYNGAPK